MGLHCISHIYTTEQDIQNLPLGCQVVFPDLSSLRLFHSLQSRVLPCPRFSLKKQQYRKGIKETAKQDFKQHAADT